MTATPIQTTGLTYRYGTRRGVTSVDLSVRPGSLFGFLGPNGAGKTTAIRLLLGFLRPTSGHAKIFGLDCWSDTRAIKRDVGYVPGDLRLWPWLNGHSALAMFGHVRQMNIQPMGHKLAELFELDLKVPVRRMSKGMRQKLGLITAMAHEPRLLILDEPSSGLDPLMQNRMQEYLREVARKGATVLFSSHTLAEVENLCDDLAIVREGKIVAAGTLEELRRTTGHEVTLRFASENGMPQQMNDGLTVTQRDGRTWTCMYTGKVDALMRELASYELDDVSITRPDLDSIFRRFYEVDAERAGPTDSKGQTSDNRTIGSARP